MLTLLNYSEVQIDAWQRSQLNPSTEEVHLILKDTHMLTLSLLATGSSFI